MDLCKKSLNKIELESKLTIENILDLKSRFDSYRDEGIYKQELVELLQKLTKIGENDEEFANLIHQVELMEEKENRISWNSFLNYLLENFRHFHELKLIKTFPTLDLRHNYLLMTHNRRQPTVKLLTILASTLIYVTISKLGVVGILNRHLKLQKTYNVDLNDLQKETQAGSKRTCQAWITDAIHMPDCKKLVVASTKRILHFFDISAATHMEEFRIFALPNSATCFTYSFNKEKSDKVSLLFFGDDAGNIHQLKFRQPQILLFKKKDMEGLMKFYFMDLDQHEEYVSYNLLPKEHDGSITSIQYMEHNKSLISCSDGESSPVIIENVDGKLPKYVFRLNKGIKCFDLNRSLNILVTGSRDGLLRLWNPYVTEQPTTVLEGHLATVLDVRIVYEHCVVVSYSIDTVVKIWDLLEHICIQTVQLRFPVAKQPGMDLEHGMCPLHLETFKSTSILVACKDYITELSLVKTRGSKWQIESGDIFATAHKAIISGCESAEVSRKESDLKRNPSIATSKPKTFQRLPSYATVKSETEASEDFAKYIFFKLKQYKGHMCRSEMLDTVQHEMPFQALKVHDIENVAIESNLPMSERMKRHRMSCQNETDLLNLNLNFASGSPTERRSFDLSMSRSSIVGLVTTMGNSRRKRLELPKISTTLSSRSPSRTSSPDFVNKDRTYLL